MRQEVSPPDEVAERVSELTELELYVVSDYLEESQSDEES